jgi:exodeoxyribonuclease VII small subunit
MTRTGEQPAEPRFEDALARLETLVAEMEGGQVSLDESMARFVEGMKLVDYCGRKLSETEKKIELLLRKNADGKPEWTAFEPPPAPDAETP